MLAQTHIHTPIPMQLHNTSTSMGHIEYTRIEFDKTKTLFAYIQCTHTHIYKYINMLCMIEACGIESQFNPSWIYIYRSTIYSQIVNQNKKNKKKNHFEGVEYLRLLILSMGLVLSLWSSQFTWWDEKL